ncbi:MAG: isochorismatase family protein [Methylovirgula sp.]|uniref:isochorismatase family protein n=1 Tax=Methylovirgula sp. TaxID=1978224 RepID=UPI0030763340
MRDTADIFSRQGFGASFASLPPYGLLIVDFVNGFADPDIFGGGNIAPAIARSGRLLSVARECGLAIAYSRIVFSDDDADENIFSLKVPGLLSLKEDELASQIVPVLAPQRGELVVRKNVPSAFFGTSLASWLTQRGVRTLAVAGCVTSGCVRASVVDAMSFGFRPVVISDCVGDRAEGPHASSLFDMAQKYALVMPRDEFLPLLHVMNRR